MESNLLFVIASLIFILGYLIAFFIDHLPLSLRSAGKILDVFPLSTLRATQIMMANRLGAVLFFTSSGFLVDIGSTMEDFLLLFSLSWLFLGLLSLIYILLWKSFFVFISKYLLAINEPIAQVKSLNFSLKYTFTNYPFIFNTLGVSIPIISASLFPEFRASLLQIGFAFNSIASLLLIFVIEPKFVSHISNDEPQKADKFHQELIYSKSIILFLSGFSTVILYVLI